MTEPEKYAYAILAEVLGGDLARDVIAHRQGKKCPLTPGGAKGLVKEYLATGDAVVAAGEHLNRGWQGFKADWLQKGKGFEDPHNPMPKSPFMKRQQSIKDQLVRDISGEIDEFTGQTFDLSAADYRAH